MRVTRKEIERLVDLAGVRFKERYDGAIALCDGDPGTWEETYGSLREARAFLRGFLRGLLIRGLNGR